MDKCRRQKKTWNYKESIGQAKQGTKEQNGKFSWMFVELSLPNKGTANDVSSLPLIYSLSIRRATNRRRTKTETLRFEWAEAKIQMQINGELES